MNRVNETTAYRTWNLTIPVYLEGAWQMTLAYTLTAYRIGDQIVAAFVDGMAASIERAAHLLAWAQADGKLEMVAKFDGTAPIGKRIACQLHKDLAGLGIVRHYVTAQEALGRPITTLAALTTEEAQDVWSYACAISDRPTLPSIVYQGVSA